MKSPRDFTYRTVEHGQTEMVFYITARRNGWLPEQAEAATIAFVDDCLSNWHNVERPTRGELFDSIERVMFTNTREEKGSS